jgi:YidC/Oxa1 family membrane protein insertase
MMVFVLFLMYQERQYEEAALRAQSQVEGETGDDDGDVFGAAPRDALGDRRAGGARTSPEEVLGGSGREASGPLDQGHEESLSTPRGRSADLESPAIPLRTLTLENENVVAKISNGPALIESWRIRSYEERLPEGRVPIDLVSVSERQAILSTRLRTTVGTAFDEARFEVVSSNSREVVQRATSELGVLTRTLRLDEQGYGFDLELGFESRQSRPMDARLEILWPVQASERLDFKELSLLAYSPGEGVTREMAAGVGQAGFFGRLMGGSSDRVQEIEGPVRWAGFDVRYFTGVLIDPDPGARPSLDVAFEMVEPASSARARIAPPVLAVGPGGTVSQSLRGYFGPKDPEALFAAGHGLEHTINRGWSWLEPLTRLFEIALTKLYVVIPNYGLAIIVLTILVRALVSPLMVRQMRSAEKMRAVQPRVKALQEKYKDDRQKQSEEMMKLWREEGINPLGGCLPVFLQFPVLIGLFYALQSSIELRQAPFVLWIDDLSQPATLFTIPGLEFPVRVLPIIMGASMFVQQKMTPTTGMDPAQARMMLIMMPGMMLLISYTFPSGLVLYWTVSNLLGIAHQYWIRKKMQPAS